LDSVGNKFGVDIIPLLSKYQVDLYLSGHEHTYMVIDESNWKEYIIPPIIIAGSAGNNEFIRSKEKIGMKGFKEKTLIPKYGYGYLSASKLSLSWKWGSTASDGSKNPTAKDWEQEDEYEIMNKNISKENIEEGTPVETPSRPTDSSVSQKVIHPIYSFVLIFFYQILIQSRLKVEVGVEAEVEVGVEVET
jgi:hypothetical protein